MYIPFYYMTEWPLQQQANRIIMKKVAIWSKWVFYECPNYFYIVVGADSTALTAAVEGGQAMHTVRSSPIKRMFHLPRRKRGHKCPGRRQKRPLKWLEMSVVWWWHSQNRAVCSQSCSCLFLSAWTCLSDGGWPVVEDDTGRPTDKKGQERKGWWLTPWQLEDPAAIRES